MRNMQKLLIVLAVIASVSVCYAHQRTQAIDLTGIAIENRSILQRHVVQSPAPQSRYIQPVDSPVVSLPVITVYRTANEQRRSCPNICTFRRIVNVCMATAFGGCVAFIVLAIKE